jgi:uncharacterized iron-regulated membrane protein
MAQRFVPPKGALILMMAGVATVAASLLLPRGALGIALILLGAVAALIGVIWQVVARIRWRTRRRPDQPPSRKSRPISE